MLYPNNLSLLSLLTSFAFSALTLAQDASETVIRNPLTETTTADAQDDEFAGTTAPPENPVAEGTIGNRNGSPGGDSKAGARGPDDGSFSLSKGGMIAVIVVVVIVVLVGIASAVLYVVAKRRQWEVRKSIVRASRRLTGRRDTSTNNRSNGRKSQGLKVDQTKGRARPSAIHVNSSPSTTNRSTTPPKSRNAPGSDLEKGKLHTTVKSKETETSETKEVPGQKKSRFLAPWK